MFVRLGFAYAAMSQPAILLWTRCWRSGEMKVQKKCYDYLHTLSGTVSSIISSLTGGRRDWALCDQGSSLGSMGEIRVAGSVENVIRADEDETPRWAAPPRRRSR